MGDLALGELADLLGCGGLAGLQLDPGADLLAVARIGHADYLVEPVAEVPPPQPHTARFTVTLLRWVKLSSMPSSENSRPMPLGL